MERLSALDAEFLHLEDGVSHMHIAGMSVFRDAPPTEDELIALLASKLHLIPRYRERLQAVPFELGRPVWVDDPHFHLDYHVRATALPEPTDEALCALMGRLMSQELDRHRPLWECWIVHGLPDGRWALISKVHHCMVDGIAGVGLLEALFDLDPAAPLASPVPWTPTPLPSTPALVFDAWGGLLEDVGRHLTTLPARAIHPWAAVRAATDTGRGIVRYVHDLAATPPTSVDGAIGPHRRWAHASAALDDVRDIRAGLGGTVNDIVLTAISQGYRDLLLSRGEDPGGTVMRTLVPVSVRTADASGATGNHVSALLYDLPVGIDDPVERLRSVQAQLTELKTSHMAEAGVAVTAFVDLVPPMLVGNVSRLLMRVVHDRSQRAINTVTTNVPGPQIPLYCLGRELIEHRPFVPISYGLRFGTAVLSYHGRLCFGVTGDYDTAPEVGVVAEGIVAGIDELRKAA